MQDHYEHQQDEYYRQLKEKRAMKRILEADDEYIINFM